MPRISPHLLVLLALLSFSTQGFGQVIQHEESEVGGILAQLSDIDGDGAAEYLTVEIVQPGLLVDAVIRSVALDQVLVRWPIDWAGIQVAPDVDPYDLNGDGFFDVVYLQNEPALGHATLEARSGLDGSLLWRRDDFPGPADFTNWATSIGDENGDGITDFIQSLRDGNMVHFSGVDGSTLQQSTGGGVSSVYGHYPIGDMDRDGLPDYFVEIFFGSSVFSGATDQFLFFIPATNPLNSLCGVGDTNGDGFDDFAFVRVPAGNGRRPIEIRSGFPPRRVGWIPGHHAGESCQNYSLNHYDWDGDGTQDIVSWGKEAKRPPSYLATPGYMRIHSVSRGEDLFVLPTQQTARPGNDNITFFKHDYDGDGKPDPFFVSALDGGHPTVFSLKKHLQVGSPTISQSAGGTLVFTLDVNSRFALKDAFLLAGINGNYSERAILTGSEFFGRFGIRGGIALPFGRLGITNQLWNLRGSGDPKEATFTLPLDSLGRGSLSLYLGAGVIPTSLIGRKLKFAFLLPDHLQPQFPEGITEAVAVEVLP